MKLVDAVRPAKDIQQAFGWMRIHRRTSTVKDQLKIKTKNPQKIGFMDEGKSHCLVIFSSYTSCHLFGLHSPLLWLVMILWFYQPKHVQEILIFLNLQVMLYFPVSFPFSKAEMFWDSCMLGDFFVLFCFLYHMLGDFPQITKLWSLVYRKVELTSLGMVASRNSYAMPVFCQASHATFRERRPLTIPGVAWRPTVSLVYPKPFRVCFGGKERCCGRRARSPMVWRAISMKYYRLTLIFHSSATNFNKLSILK